MAVRKLRLSKRRQAWVGSRSTTLNGETLRFSIAAGDRYARCLTKAVKQMTDEVKAEIQTLFESPEAEGYFAQDASLVTRTRILFSTLNSRFQKAFRVLASESALAMINDINRVSERQTKSSLKKLSAGLTLNTDFVSEEMGEMMKASVLENRELIKDLPHRYLRNVSNMVVTNLTQPNTGGLKQLIKQIDAGLSQEQKRVHNKARNNALDQTRKAFNNLNAARMKAVGITKFRWVHSKAGQKPREYHLNELDGKVFSFDDPPIIDERTKERGLPSQLINCRCSMMPVIEFKKGEKQK